MKKKQIVFHAVFLAVIALVWVPFAMQYLQETVGWPGLDAILFGVALFWCHGVLIVPVLCLLYGALAPWMHPTQRPVFRMIRSGVLLLAVIWIVLDFLLFHFFFPAGEWGSIEEWTGHAYEMIFPNEVHFSYVMVVVFSGFLHVTELYFPYPRKGKIGDIVLCVLPALVMAAGSGYFIWRVITAPEEVWVGIFFLPFPLSLYVLYASFVKTARRGVPFRRKILLVLSMVFACLNLVSPILVFNTPFPTQGIRVLSFYMAIVGPFFAQWALGVLQRSLEANWEKEDREKEQAAQEQEVQAFPAEQESEALPEGREQEALPTAQEASV